MDIIISSESDELMLDAEMIKTKADFYSLGFKKFPSDAISEMCPFKTPKKINEWMRRAGSVWRLRNRDKEMIQSFKDCLENLKTE